jgi:pimeloyl-ACP methyl ester carboxylesterase
MRNRFITLNNQRFHLHEWGQTGAPRMLLLHGFPEYGGAWSELAQELADTYHLIAPDQRGYGQSYAPQEVGAYAAPALIGDMAALLETFEGPTIVVGHDWGAAVAYGLAIARPDLVSQLVILNGVHPGPFQRALARGGDQAAASQYIHYLRRDGAEDRLARDDFAGLLGLFAEGMDMSWMTPERAALYKTEWARPGRLTGMINWYRATGLQVPRPGETLDIPDLAYDKFHVAPRHLLIWGDGDRALLTEATEGLEAYCADLTRRSVPGADHWIAHQCPAEVAQILRDWLG